MTENSNEAKTTTELHIGMEVSDIKVACHASEFCESDKLPPVDIKPPQQPHLSQRIPIGYVSVL
jgi:hypothetical protein